MAKETIKTYKVKIEGRPNYCGIGPGGAQFAHGEALITNARLADWFREHDGYAVEAVEPAAPPES